MAESTYFVQECPTCGRNLHVRVEYLGRRVVCQHCRGSLVARDASMGPSPTAERTLNLLERVEELLDMAEQRKQQMRA